MPANAKRRRCRVQDYSGRSELGAMRSDHNSALLQNCFLSKEGGDYTFELENLIFQQSRASRAENSSADLDVDVMVFM